MLRLLGSAVFAFLAFAPERAGSGQSDPPPMAITTDTVQYCTELARLVGEELRRWTVPPPPEVADLTRDGRRMCQTGMIRGGIARLRRAMVLLEHPEAER